MALSAGTRLGPYEILAPLGAGGMGEVYRARDPRLHRDVAIKVLPERFASNPEAVKRFHSEATTTGALNHPNILAVYDTGTHGGHPYLVTELLDGETLRDRMGGASLPVRKVLDYSVQIARGLAAAHEKGVVHRDLKPSNLFVTKDGVVKILDFGLATVRQGVGTVDSEVETMSVSPETEPGTVLGTVGYMAPEQVKGHSADDRSDIFSFGAVLYEMLAGQKAFRGETRIDVMNAILRVDPPDPTATDSAVSPGLYQVVARCLEKRPAERLQSARDLAFYLETLSGSGSGRALASAETATAIRPSVRRILAAAVLLTIAATGWFVGRSSRPPGDEQPTFRQLTFRRGRVHVARFGPDAETVVYGAVFWGRGDPPWPKTSVFTGRVDNPEARSLGEIGVLDLSSREEMLVMREDRVLARQSVAGGPPRDLLEGVAGADWAPDGEQIAVIRDNPERLEYPVGNVLGGNMGAFPDTLRVSPGGDRVAFLRPQGLVIIDKRGKEATFSLSGWSQWSGLAWSADGSEVWLSGRNRDNWALHGVSPSGQERVILRTAEPLRLCDIAPDGRVLVVRRDLRIEMRGRLAGDERERDLSWLGLGSIEGISADGRRLLFHEHLAEGTTGSVYLWDGGEAAPVRLGGGDAWGLSPDGEWALTRDPVRGQLVLVPTGPGEPRRLRHEGLKPSGGGRFLPDSDHLIFAAREGDKGRRTLYVMPLDGGPPSALGVETPPSVYPLVVSPDGQWFVGSDSRRYSLSGGEPETISGVVPYLNPIGGWHADGRSLFVIGYPTGPFAPGESDSDAFAAIFRIDLTSGGRTVWKELEVPDPEELGGCQVLSITPDGEHYAYQCLRELSTLYLVEGLQ